jgi:tetratricopeptide (TPR) repeat protein
VIGRFLRELKRRRVLNTAFLYVIGAWIALQVVEVLSGAGLPPSTMRNLLIILSFGFPLALIVGWFFDISTEGIKKTGPLKEGEQLPNLKFLDHVFLAGLILVVAMDAYILSFPTPQDTPVVSSTTSQQRTIAVLGFDDLELAAGGDPIGEMLRMSGENRYTVAKELLVTALVLGEVLLDGGRIKVSASLVGVPAGNEIWSARIEGPVGDAVDLQNGLIRQIIGAAAPNLDPDPVQGSRVEADSCNDVYSLYLRGKQLSQKRRSEGDMRERGVELLREAVAIDDQCALAWEAIAVEATDWSFPGFVRAGAAARRALELNESLPEAWTVLAEIAEQEERWSDAEEYFLRALYADPTNTRANMFYSETLVARGRLKEALHYALEAYRYEPASSNVNFHVSLAAGMAGDGDLTLKHATIFGELIDKPQHAWVLNLLAEGYLLNGETDRALEAYAGKGDKMADWFPECVRARDDPGKVPGLVDAMEKTILQYKSGQLTEMQAFYWLGDVIGCSIWLGEPDFAFELLLDEDSTAFFGEPAPTEAVFLNMFTPDGEVLRQDPRFRKLVVDSGLLDYWRQWGWSDYCEADGDSFRCD